MAHYLQSYTDWRQFSIITGQPINPDTQEKGPPNEKVLQTCIAISSYDPPRSAFCECVDVQ